jgi:hypothetical protein
LRGLRTLDAAGRTGNAGSIAAWLATQPGVQQVGTRLLTIPGLDSARRQQDRFRASSAFELISGILRCCALSTFSSFHGGIPGGVDRWRIRRR